RDGALAVVLGAVVLAGLFEDVSHTGGGPALERSANDESAFAVGLAFDRIISIFDHDFGARERFFLPVGGELERVALRLGDKVELQLLTGVDGPGGGFRIGFRACLAQVVAMPRGKALILLEREGCWLLERDFR